VGSLASLSDGRLVSGDRQGNKIRFWTLPSVPTAKDLSNEASWVELIPRAKMEDDWGSCIATRSTGSPVGWWSLLALADDRLVSGHWDGNFRVWSEADVGVTTESTFRVTRTVHAHNPSKKPQGASAVNGLALLDDGRVASAGNDFTVVLTDLDKAQSSHGAGSRSTSRQSSARHMMITPK
jgi:hypothetical protein